MGRGDSDRGTARFHRGHLPDGVDAWVVDRSQPCATVEAREVGQDPGPPER